MAEIANCAGPANPQDMLSSFQATDGKVVASSEGTLKTDVKATDQDTVILQQVNGNQTLTEIDFSHRKEQILFTQPKKAA